jgi:hypothetical protein
VPNMGTGRCLDPGENRTGLEGGGEAGPSLPERGKDRQLKPSGDGDNMKKKKKSPFRCNRGGSAANRVSSRLITPVFNMSVIF